MENSKEKMIQEVITLEWNFFDKVQNEGGRAYCQDDYATFSTMRRSQYSAWDCETLASWKNDLETARACGRNPLTEKYGYMMVIEDPDANAKISAALPEVSFEKKYIAMRISNTLAPQNRAFAAKYPHIATHTRPLTKNDEREGELTSIERYQLGELWTYSVRTLNLLLARITALKEEGVSYAELIIGESLKQRGFPSLDFAEKYLAEREA